MSIRPFEAVKVELDCDPKSLRAMVIRASCKNSVVDNLDTVGDREYYLWRPILASVKTAAQLHLIEQNSPQIIGEDAELWIRFIKRDIQDGEKMIKDKHYEPEDGHYEKGFKYKIGDWRQVYLRYKQNAREKEIQAQAALRNTYGAAMHKDQSIKVSAMSLPKLPRDPRMVANAGIPLSRRNYGGHANEPKPRNAVEKARRETGKMIQLRTQAMATVRSQIHRPPASLVAQHAQERMAKERSLPASPGWDVENKEDPIEARIAQIKAAKAAKAEAANEVLEKEAKQAKDALERNAKQAMGRRIAQIQAAKASKGGSEAREADSKRRNPPSRQQRDDSADIDDLFGDEPTSPKTSQPRVRLARSGIVRKPTSPTTGAAKPSAPPLPRKKVDIFYTAKKSLPKPPPAVMNTSRPPPPPLAREASAFDARPPRPPVLTGSRGVQAPAGTRAQKKAVEMRSMRPVTAVADRHAARAAAPISGAPAAATSRPVTSTMAGKGMDRQQSRTASPAVNRGSPRPQQRSSTGGSGVTSMLAGLVAKQDVARSTPPSSSASMKRRAPDDFDTLPPQKPETMMQRGRSLDDAPPNSIDRRNGRFENAFGATASRMSSHNSLPDEVKAIARAKTGVERTPEKKTARSWGLESIDERRGRP